MVNAKLNSKILGKTLAPFLMVPPLERACHLARDLNISPFAFATRASIISFEYDSQVVLLKAPHYLTLLLVGKRPPDQD